MTELLPDAPEALGLLALMLYADARRFARRTPDGDYVPLAEQDTELWDDALIDEAEALLVRASSFGVAGRYQLEAALQSAHVNGRRAGRTDWRALLALYDALLELSGSPVIAINRALALANVAGPDAALAALDALEPDGRLAQYQPYWAARAELLARIGARSEANEAYARAIGLEREPSVRQFLQRRRAAVS